MPLAISNIAWDPADDDTVAAIIRAEGCAGLEIAPTKRWERPAEATPTEIAEYRRIWQDRGLPIIAMQSLLFGEPELQLFGDVASRAALREHLERIIDLGAELGARALVFGSPKNRMRGDMPLPEAERIAVELLSVLGERAHARGVEFCLEPVPPRYGSDFLTTPDEAVKLARRVASPGLRVNADLGAIVLAGDDPHDWIVRNADLIGHVHASETDFVETHPGVAHERAAAGLRDVGYAGWVSLEISRQAIGGSVEAIRRAVRVGRSTYFERKA